MRRFLGAAILAFGTPALAEPPQVVADVAPVRSLVAAVMDGVAEPGVVLPVNASPHDFAFRPASARALQEANAVFWIGADLTPWLEQPLQTLADGAAIVTLSEIEGVTLREAGEHGHDHGHKHGIDPHLWLDPENALRWLPEIAEALGALDPENRDLYLQNAEAEAQKLKALAQEISARLTKLEPVYVVFHDAFGYFESRFGIDHLAAVTDVSDAAMTPARLRTVQQAVAAGAVRCALAEPGFDPDLVTLIFGETAEVTVAVIDPLGGALAPGPDQYRQILRQLTDTLEAC